jgi:hypothetical protein
MGVCSSETVAMKEKKILRHHPIALSCGPCNQHMSW